MLPYFTRFGGDQTSNVLNCDVSDANNIQEIMKRREFMIVNLAQHFQTKLKKNVSGISNTNGEGIGLFVAGPILTPRLRAANCFLEHVQ